MGLLDANCSTTVLDELHLLSLKSTPSPCEMGGREIVSMQYSVVSLSVYLIFFLKK